MAIISSSIGRRRPWRLWAVMPVSLLVSAAALAVGGKPVDRALVAQGRYVALAADCAGCHSVPGGQPYAGGTPLKSPFGTLYGSNITPDVRTGIGSWTRTEFDRAMRLGIGKGGKYLYPAMPYDAYTKMTVADMDALWAYLRTVPAISHEPPADTLPFPFTIRSGIAVWQRLYFTPGPFVADPARGPQWNRGAYLVQALAHCSDCHTPRNLAQGPEMQHLLGGADIEGWYAPDISGDAQSSLANLSVSQLTQFLKTGVLPDNAKAFGPMQEAVHDSLRFLAEPDLRAMARYLEEQPGTQTPETAGRAQWVRPGAGRQVYENDCSSCHGADGKGRPGSVPGLAGNASITAAEPYNVISALLEGFDPQQSWGPMPAFAATLSDTQIADVTNYVRGAWNNEAAPNATASMVRTWRRSADAPKDESHALLCPDLTAGVERPALLAGTAALKQAASSRARMTELVASYRLARPDSSTTEVMDALSAAYCRAVATDPISATRMSAELMAFAQRVAVVLVAPTPPVSGSSAPPGNPD